MNLQNCATVMKRSEHRKPRAPAPLMCNLLHFGFSASHREFDCEFVAGEQFRRIPYRGALFACDGVTSFENVIRI